MTEKYKLQQEDIKSMDLNGETLAKLKQILPEVFAEGADGKHSIDIEKLKIALGGAVDVESDNKTRYSFNWSGKKQVQALANQPSTATLRPSIEDSKNWDNTQNVYIEGDNLEVLKLLQTSYYGQIKMIYIDPPYNTGKDFVYKDNFHDNVKNYLQLTGQVDDEGNRISTNTDKSGRYHTDWLNMMYPRLKLARNLLKDDGVIFISIDDNEVHNLRKICDEIFGEDNFVAIFPWRKRTAKSDVPFGVSQDFEWIVACAKSNFMTGIAHERKYYKTADYPDDGWRLSDLTTQRSSEERQNSAFNMVDPKTGKIYPFNPKRVWGVTNDTFQTYYDKGKIVFPDDYDFLNISIPAYRVFESEDKAKALKKHGTEDSIKALSTQLPKEVGLSEDGNKQIVELFGDKVFSFPKSSSLLKYFYSAVTSNNDIILDFFSGSATTAHAVMQLNAEDGGNRKYICVQLPETTAPDSEAYKAGYKNICEIGKERIRRAGEKVLAEWTEKHAKKDLLAEDGKSITPPDIGFKVFKLDTSNLKPFDANDMFADDLLVDGRSALDLFYELVLKQGYSLDNRQAMLDIGGTRCYALVHEDNTPFVLAVLDDKVKPNFALELLKYTLTLVIVKDECFGTDEIKLNLLSTLEQLQSKDNPLQIRIV